MLSCVLVDSDDADGEYGAFESPCLPTRNTVVELNFSDKPNEEYLVVGTTLLVGGDKVRCCYVRVEPL